MADQDSLEVLVPEAQGDLIVHAQDVRVILTPEETLVNKVQEDLEKGLLGEDLDGLELASVAAHVVLVLRMHCFEVKQ